MVPSLVVEMLLKQSMGLPGFTSSSLTSSGVAVSAETMVQVLSMQVSA